MVWFSDTIWEPYKKSGFRLIKNQNYILNKIFVFVVFKKVSTTQKSVFKWFKQNRGWYKSLWIKSAITFSINPCIRHKRNSLVRHKLFHEDLSNTHTKHLLEHFCLCFCKPVHSYGFSPDTSKTRPFEVQHSKCPAF